MRQCSIEPGTRKYVKRYGFLSFAIKYKKQLFDTGIDAVEMASKKVVHKAGKFIGNKISDVLNKSNSNKVVTQESVEKIIISLGKRDEVLSKLRTEI